MPVKPQPAKPIPSFYLSHTSPSNDLLKSFQTMVGKGDPNVSHSFSSNVQYYLKEQQGKLLRPNTLHQFSIPQQPLVTRLNSIFDSGSK